MAASSSIVSFHIHLQTLPPRPIAHRRPPVSVHRTRSTVVRLQSPSSGDDPPPPTAVGTLPSHLLRHLSISLASAALLLPSLLPLRPCLASPTPQPPSSVVLSHRLTKRHESGLKKRLRNLSDDPVFLRALVDYKAKSGNSSGAAAAAARLLALDPSDPDLPLVRAHLLARSGNLSAARAAFNKILRREPFFVPAYHGLLSVANLDPESPSAERARVLERVEKLMERCKKEKRNQVVRDLKLLVAQVRVLERNYKEAICAYNDLVKEEPRDFRPYLALGFVYSKMGMQEEADKQLAKYRRLVPPGHPYARNFEDDVAKMDARNEKLKDRVANVVVQMLLERKKAMEMLEQVEMEKEELSESLELAEREIEDLTEDLERMERENKKKRSLLRWLWPWRSG